MAQSHTPRAAQLRGTILIAFIVGAALTRLIPHPPNLTAMGALALFGGRSFAMRRAAFLVPLAAMLLSDLALHQREGWGISLMTPLIYGCIAASAGIGRWLIRHPGFAPIAGASLVSALLFFVVTNAAVWLTSGLYPRSVGGLLGCYAAALPFFGNTLAGYALYGSAIFGGFATLERRLGWESLSPTTIHPA